MEMGYARCSTDEQNLDLQLDALKTAGCEKIYSDEGISGAQIERAGLDQCLAETGAGDTLIVCKLDRLGRSLPFLIDLMNTCQDQGIGFHSITDGIDTSTTGGKLVLHIMGALAELERSLIVERKKAGMDAARRHGKYIGRPLALSQEQVSHARKSIASGETIGGMAAVLGVTRNILITPLKKCSDNISGV